MLKDCAPQVMSSLAPLGLRSQVGLCDLFELCIRFGFFGILKDCAPQVMSSLAPLGLRSQVGLCDLFELWSRFGFFGILKDCAPKVMCSLAPIVGAALAGGFVRYIRLLKSLMDF